MTRILHTSDWHLGLRHAGLPGDVGARAREERFLAVERLAGIAGERAVDVVVVCGDVFDGDFVGGAVIQRASDALERFECPVLLLPGNHDPASGPSSAIARLNSRAPGHVRALLDPSPVQAGGVWFHPAPLTRKHHRDDPTAALTPTPGSPSVALVHGSDNSRSAGRAQANVIDADDLVAKGFDYVALGDWHRQLVLGPRAAYSGTHEQTRWAERDAGLALLVDLDESGAPPTLTSIEVGRLTWVELDRRLAAREDVLALRDELAALSEPSSTLVRLRASGSLSLSDHAQLDALLAEADSFLSIDAKLGQLRRAPTDDELDALTGPGFLGEAVGVLRESALEFDSDALTLLHDLLQETSR